MPRIEVSKPLPNHPVDLSDLVKMEAERERAANANSKNQNANVRGCANTNSDIDPPAHQKPAKISEISEISENTDEKGDKNVIVNSHPDVSKKYYEWVEVLYSLEWRDLLKNQLQSEHTPFALCVEILDKVKIVDNKNVLVISAIEFIVVLIDKYGVKKENIFFLDEGQKDATMDSIKREVIIEADMIPERNILNMNEVEKMKFDYAIGNPPFQKPKEAAKRWVLWTEILQVAMKISNRVGLVTPMSLVSDTTFKTISHRITHIDYTCGEHFPGIGSKFVWSLIDSTNNGEMTIHGIDKAEYRIALHGLDCLPNDFNAQSFGFTAVLTNRTARKWKRGELHTSKKELFSDDGEFEVFHTNAQTKRTNVIHGNKDKIRVAVSLSGYPIFRVIHNSYCSQCTFWTEFETVEEARQFCDECNSEKIQSALAAFKWSGWTTKGVISML